MTHSREKILSILALFNEDGILPPEHLQKLMKENLQEYEDILHVIVSLKPDYIEHVKGNGKADHFQYTSQTKGFIEKLNTEIEEEELAKQRRDVEKRAYEKSLSPEPQKRKPFFEKYTYVIAGILAIGTLLYFTIDIYIRSTQWQPAPLQQVSTDSSNKDTSDEIPLSHPDSTKGKPSSFHGGN